MGRKQQKQRTAASPQAPTPRPPAAPATRGQQVLRGVAVGGGVAVVICLVFVVIVMAALAFSGSMQLRQRAMAADLYATVFAVVLGGMGVGLAMGLAQPHLHDPRVAFAVRAGVGTLGYGTLLGLVSWVQQKPLFTWQHLLVAIALGVFLTPPLVVRPTKRPEAPAKKGTRR